jgi:hypothetical protein
VELVGESHETNREDLTNEDVITVPVVDGPFDTFEEAVEEADEDASQLYSGGDYAAISVLEEANE